LRDQGMTLIVSSHILTELEEYSTHMLMLKAGKIIAQETIGYQHETMCDLRIILAERREDFTKVFEDVEHVSVIEIDDQQALLRVSSDISKQHELLRYLMDKALPIAAFSQEKRDMHETYLTKMQGEKS